MRTTTALPFLALLLLLAAAPAHADATDGAIVNCKAPGMTPPVALTSHVATGEDYPPLSNALGEEGSTLASYVVLPNGDVGDVTVIRSSGSLRLDDATVAFVKRFKFKPALANNAPAACVNEIKLAWSLRNNDVVGIGPLAASAIYPLPSDFPPGALERHEEGTALAAIFVNDNGTVQMADLVRGTQYDDLNIATVALLRARKIVPATLDGKPVRSVILVQVVWSPTGKPVQAAPALPRPADTPPQPGEENRDQSQVKPR